MHLLWEGWTYFTGFNISLFLHVCLYIFVFVRTLLVSMNIVILESVIKSLFYFAKSLPTP